MNGTRAKHVGTPEGRIAAYARQWVYANWPRQTSEYPPDYAELEELIRYRVRRELILARLEEAKAGGQRFRMRELVQKLKDLDTSNAQDTPPEDVERFTP